jgi:hypothetical protein
VITIYYNPVEIEYACATIRRKGETPILYVSEKNAAKLAPINALDNDLNIDQKSYHENNGFIGTYHGCYIYVTDAVGDLWVVVPMCKENKEQ